MKRSLLILLFLFLIMSCLSNLVLADGKEIPSDKSEELLNFPNFTGSDRLYIWQPGFEPIEEIEDFYGSCDESQFSHDGFIIGTRSYGFTAEKYQKDIMHYEVFEDDLDIQDLIKAITIKNHVGGFSALAEEYDPDSHVIVAKVWFSYSPEHYWDIARKCDDSYVLIFQPIG